jgi:hypothetical protein
MVKHIDKRWQDMKKAKNPIDKTLYPMSRICIDADVRTKQYIIDLPNITVRKYYSAACATARLSLLPAIYVLKSSATSH